VSGKANMLKWGQHKPENKGLVHSAPLQAKGNMDTVITLIYTQQKAGVNSPERMELMSVTLGKTGALDEEMSDDTATRGRVKIQEVRGNLRITL